MHRGENLYPGFLSGDRVTWRGHTGTVLYRRFRSPEFVTVAAYSIIFDDRKGEANYCGTVVPADEVRKEDAR